MIQSTVGNSTVVGEWHINVVNDDFNGINGINGINEIIPIILLSSLIYR